MTPRVPRGVPLVALGLVLPIGATCGDGGGTALDVVARVRFDQRAGPVALAVLRDGEEITIVELRD